MNNKNMKTLSLTLGVLLASSHLFAAALPEDPKIRKASISKSDQLRLAELQKQAESGDINSQKKLNALAGFGAGGFNEASGLAYLKKRAEEGDADAQNRLKLKKQLQEKKITSGTLIDRMPEAKQQLYKNNGAANGMLGFTEASGLAYLKKRAEEGDADAQEQLNKSAAYRKLGFTDESGFLYLTERAKYGDRYAQVLLNQAALDGRLGFTEASGLAYLKKRAEEGDGDAHGKLNYASAGGQP